MSGFELITITFSFVLGLGVAQILSSVAYVVREKEAKYGQAHIMRDRQQMLLPYRKRVP